ncbi:uncharacterized protein LOC128966574 [Homo sapiens]|jgi:hypothetical protein|uniref:uncharacterized protein LOC128966574 n=1 Tax=Homo sapiens TaxID=9606 RepID=UPI000387C277|nr:uncharacterized protein LOC124904095 isoform X2 [Homo sapiens]XP_047302779.1 uncharacterized protein LOC124904095 isoform X3 [Homo sapiens]XP_047302780.1 uncharacterized protein LOC128966574 [Homo sapiens]|eukprot:XP_011545066.1 uncharacterized protein LOC105371944 isoform X2 [Homo sapiens]
MRCLCFPELWNVLGPAAVLSFCQHVHTARSLVSCQDPWDYGTSRAAFSGHCPHLWAPVASRPLALGRLGGRGVGGAGTSLIQAPHAWPWGLFVLQVPRVPPYPSSSASHEWGRGWVRGPQKLPLCTSPARHSSSKVTKTSTSVLTGAGAQGCCAVSLVTRVGSFLSASFRQEVISEREEENHVQIHGGSGDGLSIRTQPPPFLCV